MRVYHIGYSENIFDLKLLFHCCLLSKLELYTYKFIEKESLMAVVRKNSEEEFRVSMSNCRFLKKAMSHVTPVAYR